MVAVTVAVVLLPFVLRAAFGWRDRADSRGRRLDRSWRVERRSRPDEA